MVMLVLFSVWFGIEGDIDDGLPHGFPMVSKWELRVNPVCGGGVKTSLKYIGWSLSCEHRRCLESVLCLVW
ncbi:hypothetical protein Droror1_Dr00019773, partial [Drosera rotundifolia]